MQQVTLQDNSERTAESQGQYVNAVHIMNAASTLQAHPSQSAAASRPSTGLCNNQQRACSVQVKGPATLQLIPLKHLKPAWHLLLLLQVVCTGTITSCCCVRLCYGQQAQLQEWLLGGDRTGTAAAT